jgi:hypothetical protein
MNIWENYNFGNKQSKMEEKETKQLKDIRQLYNQCEAWVNSHDKSKVKIITEDSGWNSSNNYTNLKNTLYWFDEMSKLSDDKKILFGDMLLTIEDIKERILKHLKEFEDDFKEGDSFDDDEEYYGDYDDYGHASPQGYQSVVDYFQSLNERKLMAIAEGSTQDDYEVDIDGGRSYLMSGSKIFLYIFNYLYYTKKVTLKEYEDGICNSGDASDTIGEFYLENFYLPSDEEFGEMYKTKFREKYQRNFDRYNSLINSIIREFGNDSMFNDLLSEIKKLKADDAYIQAKVREDQIDKII